MSFFRFGGRVHGCGAHFRHQGAQYIVKKSRRFRNSLCLWRCHGQVPSFEALVPSDIPLSVATRRQEALSSSALRFLAPPPVQLGRLVFSECAVSAV
jgi:hypothetical protein